MELPNEVESFVNNLMPTDVGVDTVGNYIIHYEGFTDECNDGHNDETIDEVYAEVYQDFDDRQGKEALIRGVANDILGCDNNPVLYSVYKKIDEGDVVDFPSTYVKKEYVNVNGVKMLRDVWDYMSHDREEEHGFDDNMNRVHKKLSNFTGKEDPKILKKAYQMELRNFIDAYDENDMDPQPFIDELDQLDETNSFNFKLLDKDISEARLYRTTSGFNQLTGQSVAELLYLNTLITYMMLKDDKQHDYARAYAKQSTQYGKYTLFRSHATDLYLLAYLVSNPDSKSIKLRNKMASTKHLKSLNFDKRTHWQFMYKIANDRASDTLASPYLFRLESQLKIKKSMYKQWRRLIMDWENLRYIQRQSVTTRIVQELRRLGRGSEVMAPLTSMLKYKKYRIRDKTPKTDPVRRVAGAAAGAVAGRYAGKKIAQKFGKNVDKYKRAGTGLGAIAGYWASGRQRQK